MPSAKVDVVKSKKVLRSSSKLVVVELTADLNFNSYLRYHHGSSYGIIGGVTFFNESHLGSLKVGIQSFEKTTVIEYCGSSSSRSFR